MSKTYETILIETHGRVGLIRFNRPQALNALNRQVTLDVCDAVAAFDADPAIGAMVLTGSDKAFAAEFQKTFSRQDIASSYARSGLAPRYDEPLFEGVYPLGAGDDNFVGSTDVGTVSWVVPTVQCRAACYAIGTPGHSWQLVAQGQAPAAHKGIALAAKAMAGVAADVLRDPALLAAAKAEFAAFRAENPFNNPLTDDIEIPLDMAAR